MVSANTDVAANTAKVGITSGQASAITANTAKTGITTGQATAITANTAKVGYTDVLVSANTDVAANTAKVVITAAQASAITGNTAKVGYTDALVSANTDVVANTAKWTVSGSNLFRASGNVSIGTASPDAAAALEVNSTSQGFLPPRMTFAQRDLINSPPAGLILWCTDCGSNGEIQVFNGTAYTNIIGGAASTVIIWATNSVFCSAGTTSIVDVINPTTGKTWMDRNLGASQVATSSTDANSYGDLYQWGRRSDGHQCRTSGTTSTLSSVDQPAHGDFIKAPSSPNDWRSPQNTNLWQGVNGVNNPCPSGYRLPTVTELTAEISSWSSSNSSGAFASPLKLPVTGHRNGSSGSLANVGGYGFYWSSAVSSTYSRYHYFGSGSGNAGISDSWRTDGGSVRCIKD